MIMTSTTTQTDLRQRSERLAEGLAGGQVYADIDYRPLSGERGLYKGVRVVSLYQTASSAWYLRGLVAGKGYRSFKIERIVNIDVR